MPETSEKFNLIFTKYVLKMTSGMFFDKLSFATRFQKLKFGRVQTYQSGILDELKMYESCIKAIAHKAISTRNSPPIFET